jgi:hypothetical protein
MKHNFVIGLVLVSVVWLLAACGGASNEALPTLFPTAEPTEEVTATSIPSAEPTSAPVERPTLPPTWTVSPVPSETPLPTLDPTTQAQLAAATLVVCGSFAPDRERTPTEHSPGSPVTVYWTPVATAARYRVMLISETGTELFSDYTLEATYTFSADLFRRNLRYAWEVYPEDARNQQMCFARGGELLPAP